MLNDRGRRLSAPINRMYSYLIALEENMAHHKKSTSLALSLDPVFDKISPPAKEATRPGIHGCTGCGAVPGWMGEGEPVYDRMGAGK